MHGNLDIHSWTPDSCSRLVEVTGDTLRPGGLELTEQLLAYGNFPADSRVLDAGCGMGTTARYLSRTRRVTAVGVDSSESMLKTAHDPSLRSPLICAALEKLPFAAASFDGIVCECVLSQTAVPAVLAEFQRVLRVNGKLLVSDLYRRAVASPDSAPDKRSATKEQIEALLKDAGFVVEHWEDRTRDLRQLAAQLIMAPGATRENLFGWCGLGCDVSGADTGTGLRDLGYYLLAARRVSR
jgi:SAM-dependent methyltransferase